MGGSIGGQVCRLQIHDLRPPTLPHRSDLRPPQACLVQGLKIVRWETRPAPDPRRGPGLSRQQAVPSVVVSRESGSWKSFLGGSSSTGKYRGTTSFLRLTFPLAGLAYEPGAQIGGTDNRGQIYRLQPPIPPFTPGSPLDLRAYSCGPPVDPSSSNP